MAAPPFVDVHTHVVPSGDDGARTVEEGLALCELAAQHGTRILFATPHRHAPWDSYPWSRDREEQFVACLAEMREPAAEFGIDLRPGTELFPSVAFDGDPLDYVLEGTRSVLCEFPGAWLDFPDQLALVARAAEHISAAGLVPVLAHPERSGEVQRDPGSLAGFVERGWLLCANGPSFTGEHGERSRETVWRLVNDGLIGLVASDGHRLGRPPVLDEAWASVVAEIGEAKATPLFDGSALPWL